MRQQVAGRLDPKRSEAVGIFVNCDFTIEVFKGCRKRALRPYLDLISPIRHSGDMHFTGFVRDSVIRRFHRHNHCAHLRMDVAKNKGYARAIELHATSRSCRIKPQIKALPVEKRKYIVKKGIFVWEIHQRSNWHDQKVGIEAFVELHELEMARKRLKRGSRLCDGRTRERGKPKNDVRGVGHGNLFG